MLQDYHYYMSKMARDANNPIKSDKNQRLSIAALVAAQCVERGMPLRVPSENPFKLTREGLVMLVRQIPREIKKRFPSDQYRVV